MGLAAAAWSARTANSNSAGGRYPRAEGSRFWLQRWAGSGYSGSGSAIAAVALYVAHYNLCRIHEALKATPAKALGVVDRTWAIGELIYAALATQPIAPVPTAPDMRKRFIVIQGGKK